jgi:hypothetical protein
MSKLRAVVVMTVVALVPVPAHAEEPGYLTLLFVDPNG